MVHREAYTGRIPMVHREAYTQCGIPRVYRVVYPGSREAYTQGGVYPVVGRHVHRVVYTRVLGRHEAHRGLSGP